MRAKRGWLLQLIGDEPIDPIRIQKGMFLFAKESGAPQTETYEFVPYNWGPCSFEIYGDLDVLVEKGQLEKVPVPGATWHRYKRTAAGDVQAQAFAKKANAKNVAHVTRIRDSVRHKGFDRLLTDVYKKYPEYATKSLFRKR